MKLLDIIRTANSNLLRSKLRTALTLLAIFVGTFTLTLTTSIGEGIKDYIDKQTAAISPKDFMIVIPKHFFSGGDSGPQTSGPKEYSEEKKVVIAPKFLTQQDVTVLSGYKEIISLTPLYQTRPEYLSYKDGKKYESTSTDIFVEGFEMALAAGKLPEANDKKSMLLSYRFLKPLGFEKPEDAVGKKIDFVFRNAVNQERKESLEVKGVLINSLAGQNNLLTLDVAKDVYAFQNGTADSFTFMYARLKSGLSETRIKEIQKELLDKGYSGQTFEQSIGEFKTVINIAQYSLGFFSGIVILAAALGVINTLLMSVYERTREIGLMKALGTKGKEIFAIFAFEACSIGFWGGLLGVGIASITGTILNAVSRNTFLKEFEGFDLFTFPPLTIGAIMLGVIIVGFLAGTLPAIKASRLNPIDALRHE